MYPLVVNGLYKWNSDDNRRFVFRVLEFDDVKKSVVYIYPFNKADQGKVFTQIVGEKDLDDVVKYEKFPLNTYVRVKPGVEIPGYANGSGSLRVVGYSDNGSAILVDSFGVFDHNVFYDQELLEEYCPVSIGSLYRFIKSGSTVKIVGWDSLSRKVTYSFVDHPGQIKTSLIGLGKYLRKLPDDCQPKWNPLIGTIIETNPPLSEEKLIRAGEYIGIDLVDVRRMIKLSKDLV